MDELAPLDLSSGASPPPLISVKNAGSPFDDFYDEHGWTSFFSAAAANDT